MTVSVEGNTGTLGSGPAADPGGFYLTPTALQSFPAGAFRLVSTSLLIAQDGGSTKQTYDDVLHLATTNGTARDYRATYTFAITGTTSSGTQLYPVQQIASGTQIKHTDTSGFATSILPIAPVTNPLSVSVSVSPDTLTSEGGSVTVSQTLSSTADETAFVDQLLGHLPAGATYLPASASYNGEPVVDRDVATSEDGDQLTFTGPFATDRQSPGTLTYQVVLPGTDGTYTTTAWALIAATTIDSTPETTDFAPAGATVAVGTVAPQAQTITFPDLADVQRDDTAPTLNATASSELPVTYTSSTTDVCTVSGGVVSLVGTGTCTVTASQAGSSSFAPAPDVSRSFTVSRASQTITFPALADVREDQAAPTLNASASSEYAVTYASSTTDVCTVEGATITLHAAGTCTITASQAGSSSYAPAPDVSRSFTVSRAPVTPAAQTITFAPLPDVRVNQTVPTLSGTASSGLTVSYASSTPRVCTVSGATVTLHATGTCIVTASQGGDTDWAAAASVARSFDVTAVPQAIVFPAIPDQRVDEAAPTPSATASSHLAVSYTTQTPTVCVVSGGRIELVATGACRVTASQSGDATYAAAEPVTIGFQVLAAVETIPTTVTRTTTGTTPRSIQVPGLPAGTVLSVSPATVAGIRGLARVRIHGSTVVMVAAPRFSGVLRLPVTATFEGTTALVRLVLVVSPNVAPHPRVTPVTVDRTRIGWQRSPNAHRYQVVVRGRVVCVTRRLTCTVSQLVGPSTRVTVRSLGGAGTQSARTRGRELVQNRVKLASVYFTTASARLTRPDRRTLHRVARLVLTQGFRRLQLVGHTDSRGSASYNRHLSALRSRHTRLYLGHLLARHGVHLRVGWHGEQLPQGSNGTPVGRALNRRTDAFLF